MDTKFDTVVWCIKQVDKMDVEKYMLRHNLKELPIWFYFKGMFFWIYLFILPVVVIHWFVRYPIWMAYAVVIPWSAFWGWKASKKYRSDRDNLKI